MAEQYYTVERVSQMLTIHPKTIQRYIREGKLRASKVGKSWRVTGHDLSVFLENGASPAGMETREERLHLKDRTKASAVVDISVCEKDDAIRIVNTLTAVLNAKPPELGSSSMHTQYILEENKLRITLWGGIGAMEAMIGAIALLAEQREEEGEGG